jgi:hypothetical protein
MNTIKKTLLALMISLIALSGCKKDTNHLTKDDMHKGVNKLSVADSRLVFSTLAEYQGRIEEMSTKNDDELIDLAANDSFTSMYEFYVESNDLSSLPAYDIILGLLLNPQGVIQIENYVFKINLVTETVLVYQLTSNEVANQEKVTDLYNNNKSAGISEYSTNDDLIDLLEGNFEEGKGNCSSEKLGYYYWNTSGGQVMYKIVYQKAGIYFSLQSKIKKDHWGGAEYLSISTNDHPNVGGENFWKNKKNCDTWFKADSGYGREYTIRPYSSARALTDYLFSNNFYCSDNGTPYSSTLTLDCGNIQRKCY